MSVGRTVSGEVALVSIGATVVTVAPVVMLPVVPGALLASAMTTGVVMVFAGLLMGSAGGVKE